MLSPRTEYNATSPEALSYNDGTILKPKPLPKQVELLKKSELDIVSIAKGENLDETMFFLETRKKTATATTASSISSPKI